MVVFYRAGVGAAVGFDYDLFVLGFGDYVFFVCLIEGVLYFDYCYFVYVCGLMEYCGFIFQFNIYRVRGLFLRFVVDVYGDFVIDDDVDFLCLINVYGFVDVNVQLI